MPLEVGKDQSMPATRKEREGKLDIVAIFSVEDMHYTLLAIDQWQTVVSWFPCGRLVSRGHYLCI